MIEITVLKFKGLHRFNLSEVWLEPMLFDWQPIRLNRRQIKALPFGLRWQLVFYFYFKRYSEKITQKFIKGSTNNICQDTFAIQQVVNDFKTGIVMEPGSVCSNTQGYCDVLSNCRSVNLQNTLTKLVSSLLSPTLIQNIKTWVTVSLRK